MTTAEHRPIRSFVLRQSRTSVAQQRAVDTLLPRWGIEYQPQPHDLDAVFGRRAPRVVEIGFGMGESTATIAQAHPDVDYLGIEVHRPGVGNLLKLIDAAGLTNVRVIRHDAVEVLTHMIPPSSLDGLHLFFPDPWPKKRHHKRRLVQPPFVALVASRLKPGGYVHMATDWMEYAEQMLAVLSAEPSLENSAADYADRPESRPRTKFESRGLRLGHDVRDLLFRRRARP
ncbi:MAG: tRNA (guanosine(46)-N7)-methyltransferase TrmB [Burkholderiales bacterium]